MPHRPSSPRLLPLASPVLVLLLLVFLLVLLLVTAGCGGGAHEADGASDAPASSGETGPSGEPGEAGAAASTGDERPQARDLVLVTLDTLRADALGFADGPWRTPTPHLERLAREGRRFTFAHAHNTVTLPSHANMLTGRYPYSHGVRENTGFTLGDDVPPAAGVLAAAGFETAAFVSAYTLDSRYGLGRGFETYDDEQVAKDGGDLFQVAERRGDQAVRRALEWWRASSGERRFLWLHLFDPHAPYAPPEPWASDYADRPYRGEVAAVDAFLGELLDELRVGAEPLVILTADHGEALGDHGERTHGVFAYQSTLRVPLLLWGPGVEGGVDDRLARHVDLLPTLLEAAGVAAPEGLDGRSLFAPADPETSSYFECLGPALERGWAPLRGLVQGRYKAIDLPLPELYDLGSDPGEEKNLVDTERRRFRALVAQLPEESAWPPKRGQISGEEAARLRSLGYLADSAAPRQRYGPEDDPKNLLELDGWIHGFAAAFAAGRHVEAEALARRLVAARPSMPVGHTQLAHALLAQGRRHEAVEVMEEARRQDAASPGLVRQLALALSELGRPAEALPLLDELAAPGEPGLDSDPDPDPDLDLDIQSVRGQVLQELGRPREAEAVLRRVLELEPGHAASWERLSAVALDLGRPTDAERHARRALELDAARPRSHNNLGVALLLQERVDPAFEAWQRALELDPKAFDTLYNLGMQAARFGRVELARASLRRFLAEAPAERYAADLPKARAVLERLGG